MVSLNTTQKFLIQTTPVIDNGSPAAIDGPVAFQLDAPGIVKLLPSPDGMSCEVYGAAAGSCVITPTAMAGGKPISGITVQVTVADPLPPATHLKVAMGPVVPQ